MTRRPVFGVPWLLVACLAPAAHAQEADTSLGAITARIEAETQRILGETAIPAISIALVRDGEVAWAEAFGLANVGARVPATAETYFSTGSTLKPATAAAIMRLVEDGRLTLDTPFNDIVGPALAIDGADDVTLRHMLAHHSGLEGPLNIVPLWHREPLLAPEELAGATRRTGPPAAAYRYCNECYALAGLVIERLSGLSFDAFLAEHIFGPLGAGETLPTLPSPRVVEQLALPYGSESGVAVPIEQIRTDVFAAGDAYLRAKDMAAFLAMLLNGGSYGGRRILGAASTAEILRPQFEGSNSGLGINVSRLAGRATITKNGIFTGYHSYMVGDTVTGHGVYVVANSTDAGPVIARLADFALRLLWGEDPDSSATNGPAPPAQLHAAFAALEPRDRVRLSLAGARVEGVLLGTADGTLAVQTNGDARDIAIAAIDTLWVQGRSTGRGALYGMAILGVGTGLFFGTVNRGLCDAADCSGTFVEGLGVGLLVGVPVGALLGAGIGALVPRWRRRFP